MPIGNNYIDKINSKMTVAREIVFKLLSNPCDYLHKYSITKIQLSFNRRKVAK